jgi:hypothetical protein
VISLLLFLFVLLLHRFKKLMKLYIIKDELFMDEFSRLFLKFSFKDLEIVIKMISMLKAWKSGFGSIYKGLSIYKIIIILMKHLKNNIKCGNNWQYLHVNIVPLWGFYIEKQCHLHYHGDLFYKQKMFHKEKNN